MRLGVHHRQSQHAAPAALVAAYRRHDGSRGDAPIAPALDVGGIEPQVRRARIGEVAAHELCHVGVEVLRYGATWSFDSLDIPSLSAMLCTLRVEVPVAYISATADTTARSTRW